MPAYACCDDREMPRLNHLVEGSGPTAVLLHAGVADLRMWDGQVAELLRRGFTAVRCDLRGFGGSTLAPGASYSDAEDVMGLLDELEVETFALVAASYGGRVALQVATAAPGRVDRLVLIAPAADGVDPDESLRAIWGEEGRLVEAGDLEEATELNVRTWLGPDADLAAQELVRQMQRRALELQVAAGEVDSRELKVTLDRLTMPTRIFVGAHDQSFFRATARALVEQLPAADLVELPWAGHLPTLERPHEMNLLVVDALVGI